MNAITITRKKKFAGALMPYWIITSINKAEFCLKYNLDGDACEQSASGFPVSRIDVTILDEIGTRINNGETITLELKDDEMSLFVSTMDGYLSNEVRLEEYLKKGMTVVITTKGGFKNPSHPVVE